MERGSFKKNVVLKRYAVLCRNEYGEESAVIVDAESESVAIEGIDKGLEVIAVEEYAKKR